MEGSLPVLEVLTVTFGGALTKSLLKAWLDGHPIAADLSASGIDLLQRLVPDAVERMSKRRQLEHIALECARRLQGFIDAEFSRLPEHEQTAAVLSAAATLELLPLTLPLVISHDFEPSRLESLIVEQRPTAATDDYLSADAASLYSFLIREASHYIVEISTTLPDFLTRVEVESLQRETEILQLVRQILDNLPSPPGVTTDPDEEFESEYRRFIARTLDELELFGIDLRPESKRYALSVAYITLQAARRHREEEEARVSRTDKTSPAGGDEDPDDESSDFVVDEDDFAIERVDELLAGRKRVLIRGEAGSGKTTLLRWLAVQMARSSLADEFGDLNHQVPIVIILRQFAKAELPSPDLFLSSVASTVAGGMPPGWVNRVLRDGRAAVLIDGVDELPEDKREKARQWLTDLTTAYPNATYLVTSRPPAAQEDWLAPLEFESAELLPMGLADIQRFIDHWHEAALRDLPDPQVKEGERLRQKLQATIVDRRPLRSLATSPLLCAMICALNRERRARLPEDRTELYRVALEALLQRRDDDREVDVDGAAALPLRQKLLLLQDLAFWLIADGRTDASEEEVVDRISRRAEHLQPQYVDPSEIYRLLLERSGVLRSPVPGRIDFIHRTFEEYLAAAEALQDNLLNMLVDHAHLDQWREVVILAAGQAQRTQRERLIDGLLQRGREEIAHRSTLHLLAVACLEASPEISPELKTEIASVLRSLIPPTTMTEASALASAGDLCVPLLAEHTAAGARIAAACVRTLALIGSEVALAVLSEFATDPRKTVFREVLRAWSNYDPVQFSEQVLVKLRPKNGILELREPGIAPFVDYLEGVRAVAFEFAHRVHSLDFLGTDKYVVSVDVSGSPVWDLGPVASHPEIRTLNLSACAGISDIQPLGFMQDLRTLNLSWSSVRDLTPLAACGTLRVLNVQSCPALRSLDGVPIDALTSVTADVSPISDIRALEGAPYLRNLYLRYTQLGSIDSLATLDNLSVLMLDGVEGITDLSPIGGLAGLTRLDADGTEIVSTSGLDDYPNLKTLSLRGCSQLQDLELVRGSHLLESLQLAECQSLVDVSALEGKSFLTLVDLEGAAIPDLGPLTGLSSLRVLDLSATNLPSLDPVLSSTQLQRLVLRRATVNDWSAIGRMLSLKWLVVTESNVDLKAINFLQSGSVRISGPGSDEEWVLTDGVIEPWRPRQHSYR